MAEPNRSPFACSPPAATRSKARSPSASARPRRRHRNGGCHLRQPGQLQLRRRRGEQHHQHGPQLRPQVRHPDRRPRTGRTHRQWQHAQWPGDLHRQQCHDSRRRFGHDRLPASGHDRRRRRPGRQPRTGSLHHPRQHPRKPRHVFVNAVNGSARTPTTTRPRSPRPLPSPPAKVTAGPNPSASTRPATPLSKGTRRSRSPSLTASC